MANEFEGISNPKFRMALRPDGMVHVVWAQAASVTLDDAIAVTDALTMLTGGRKACLIVDTNNAEPVERAARMEFAGRHDLFAAVALIAGTPLSRLIGNFYLTANKPMVPTQLFEDEGSAVAWLRQFAL
jgi:hypothetical protein